METSLPRAYAIELIGTFGLVFVSAGVVCVNQAAGPEGPTAPLTLHQPGVVGIALAQGLILAVLLAATAPRTGGYLNPAITLMLWVLGRMDVARAAWLMGAQLVGGVLAATCLHFTFAPDVLTAAGYGAPHVNPLAYPRLTEATRAAGTAVELGLTFFLVFAIFGGVREPAEARAGAAQTACALFGFPLTGAALNPARWFGPVLLQALQGARQPWADALVYLAGPVLGALLAGFVCFRLLRPAGK